MGFQGETVRQSSVIRLDTWALCTKDVAYVRHFFWMLLAGEALNLLSGICDKQFSARFGDIATAILLEDAKLLDVIAEPHQIAVDLCEQALKLRMVREFFDDDWLAHRLIKIGVMKASNRFGRAFAELHRLFPELSTSQNSCSPSVTVPP